MRIVKSGIRYAYTDTRYSHEEMILSKVLTIVGYNYDESDLSFTKLDESSVLLLILTKKEQKRKTMFITLSLN